MEGVGMMIKPIFLLQNLSKNIKLAKKKGWFAPALCYFIKNH
jgi:hypothetical protein